MEPVSQHNAILKVFVEECSTPGLSVTEHLSRMDDSIVELRRFRNSLAPISILPDDILVQIMSECIQEVNDRILMKLDWTTSTCHHWRILALSAPKLWAYVNLDCLSRPRTQEYIRRSRSVPLCINCAHGLVPSMHSDVRTFLATNFSRIRKVMKMLLPPDLIRLFISYLGSCAAPYLEEVNLQSLVAFPRDNLDAQIQPGMQIQLNPHTASLRRLHLHDTSISWDSSILRNLTLLRITHSSTLPPRIDDVLGALAHSSGLRDLALNLEIDHDPHDKDGPSDRLIHLPHLDYLTLSLPSHRMKRVLDRFHAPNVKYVSLTAQFNRDDPRILDPWGLLPRYIMDIMFSCKFRALCLRSYDCLQLGVRDAVGDPSKGWSLTLCCSRGFPKNSVTVVRNILLRAGEIFPVENLTTLTVEIGGISPSEWIQALSCFPTLTALTVLSQDHLRVIQALSSGRLGDKEVDIVCPQLSVLALQNFQLGSLSLQLNVQLLQCFTERAARGCTKLWTLKLASCDFKLVLADIIDVEGLQRLVEHVIIE